MRKNLIPLAALALSGAAAAQSSVTLFGVVDATMLFGRGSVANRTQLGSGGLQTSRLGFRGREDLGGDLYTSFWLEGSVNPDNGTGNGSNTNNQTSGAGTATAGRQGFTFNRQSWVAIGGNWGEVRLGRQYTPAYNNESTWDPFAQFGVATPVFATAGASFNTITGSRASNMVNYRLPTNVGGFNGEAGFWLGENASTGADTDDDGRGWGGRIGWAGGPVEVGLGVGKTQYAAGDVMMSNLGGTYNFGIVKAWAMLVRNEVASVKSTGWLLGATVPVGVGEFRVSYNEHKTHTGLNPEQNQIGVGYAHNLSKRTAVGLAFAHVKNKGGSALALNGATTAANGTSNGLDISLRHRF